MNQKNELPEWLDQDDWDDFIQHRKELRKPMTDTAKRRMLRKLGKMKDAGEYIPEVIDQSIRNGWQDIYPAKQLYTRPAAHQDYHPEPVPEYDEERAKENLEILQAEMGKVFNITGGRK